MIMSRNEVGLKYLKIERFLVNSSFAMKVSIVQILAGL